MALCKSFLLFALISTLCVYSSQVSRDEEHEEQRLQERSISDPSAALLAKLEARVKYLETHHMTVLRGRDGRDGTPGRNGRDGQNGQDGKPGAQGPLGPKGNSGQDGKQGVPGQSGGGLQYVRWGKTTCPSGADLIYKGYMGGEHYTHTGGGVNYLCLTRQPKYLNFKPGFQSGGRVYGSEYEISDNKGLLPSNLHDHGAPCAACHVKTRSAKMMIPGTYECPAGWTREYTGYLMTSHYGHAHPMDFICVDENAEATPGTSANLNGVLMYFVQGTCGSLPCKPYINERELTCAVCTK